MGAYISGHPSTLCTFPIVLARHTENLTVSGVGAPPARGVTLHLQSETFIEKKTLELSSVSDQFAGIVLPGRQ